MGKKNRQHRQQAMLEKSQKKTYSEFEDQTGATGNQPPLAGQLYYPDFYNLNQNNARERFYDNNFDILRAIARKNVIIAAIVNTRCQQVRAFAKPSGDDYRAGWKIRLKDPKAKPTKEDEAAMAAISEWFAETGSRDFDGADDREDTLEDVMDKVTREQLTIDQVALECRYDRKGRLLDFWMLDGATVKRLANTVMVSDKEGTASYRFMQEIDGRVYALYENKDIVFDYQNKRTDIKSNGYGFAYIEQAIDVITSIMYAITYNKNQFTESSVPKGILAFEGSNLKEAQFQEFRRNWQSAFSGPAGQHKIAFLQNKPIWQPLAATNKDLEFNQYIQMMASFICAVFGIDSAELGLRLNQAQSVLSENQGAKIAFSKDRGLKQLLSFLYSLFNKVLAKNKLWSKFEFVFTGVEDRDADALQELDGKEIKTYKTVNEKRAEKDLPPIEGGDIVLDSTFYQNISRLAMQKQNEQQQGDAGGGEPPPVDGMNGGGEDSLSQGPDSSLDFLTDEDIAKFSDGLIKSKDGVPVVKVAPRKIKVTFQLT